MFHSWSHYVKQSDEVRNFTRRSSSSLSRRLSLGRSSEREERLTHWPQTGVFVVGVVDDGPTRGELHAGHGGHGPGEHGVCTHKARRWRRRRRRGDGTGTRLSVYRFCIAEHSRLIGRRLHPVDTQQTECWKMNSMQIQEFKKRTNRNLCEGGFTVAFVWVKLS